MTTLTFPLPRPAAPEKAKRVAAVTDADLDRLGIKDKAQRIIYRAVSADSLKHEITVIRHTGLDERTVCKALADLMHNGHVRRAVPSIGALTGAFETIRK